jgi:target of rapamycin complex subunit LST8
MSESILLCTGGYDHTVRLWNVVQGNCSAVLQHNESQINALAISPNRSIIAAAGNPSIRLYDPVKSPITGKISNNPSGLSTSSSSANNGGLPVMVLSMTGSSEEEGHRVNVVDVIFHDNNVIFGAAEGGMIKLWDVRHSTKKSINKAILPGRPTAVYFDPVSLQAIYGEKGKVRFFDLNSNKIISEVLVKDSKEISAITALANGGGVIVGDYGGNVFHLTKESQVILDNPHKDSVTFLNVSPNDQCIVSTSADHSINLYKRSPPNTKEETNSDKGLIFHGSLIGHEKWVWDAAFSADSAYVITASTDCTARLWDVDTCQQVMIYSGQHTKGITSVALNDFP